AELDLDLVTLEKDPGNAALLDRVFRLVHTIKGAAGFLDLPRLGAITHAVEDVLGRMRARDVRPSAAVVTQILRALDVIREILAALERDGAEPRGDDQVLIDALASHAGLGASDLVPTTEAELEALFDAAPGPVRAVAGEVIVPGAPPAQDGATALHETTPPPATVRVGFEVLENLLTTVGELVLTRNQLLLAAHNGDDLYGVLQRLDQVTAALQDDMLKTRMQPVQTVWAKVPRMVRDAAHSLGKQIAVEMRGGDTELDRQVLEQVRDPLLHLIRNAADHGIESPDERRAIGKPEEGRIELDAEYRDGQIVIEVSDDGRGLDLERIREKAVMAGLVTAERAVHLSDSEIRALLMQPGFSTADQVSELSDRGVGLDVVRANIEMIGGSIDILSLAGEGTTTTLKIPLTLAIIPVLMVAAGGEKFALPQLNVQEIVRVGSGPWLRLESLHGRSCLRLRGTLIPVLPLSDVLGLEPGAGDLVVIIKVGAETYGLLVDGVFDTQEIIVKPVAPVLRHIAVFSGTTILGDGTVAMILDPIGLARAMGAAAPPLMAAPPENEDDEEFVETVEFLTFRAGQAAVNAVPLRMLTRIESVDLSIIETTDDQVVVQHRGHILPLVTVEPAAISPVGRRPALILETSRGTVGIVVD
ncbi:MAG: chemotaxis protein CheA, partial [Thalassobaculaceae bacterium]